MIYLVFSDVHSNLESLERFIQMAEAIPHDKKVCLGDMVGYNTDPNEIVNWIRGNVDIVLAGNHDYGAVGMTDTSYFNDYATKACIWTREKLSDKNRVYLRSLQVKHEEDGILWVHSSPYEPDQWHYVNNKYDAQDNFPHFQNQCCFLGHSHKPMILELNPEGKVETIRDQKYELKLGCRYLINVGSLGQPRDGNPDPSFVVYNSSTMMVEFKRYEYPLEVTQEKIRSAGLPFYLADRLEAGF